MLARLASHFVSVFIKLCCYSSQHILCCLTSSSQDLCSLPSRPTPSFLHSKPCLRCPTHLSRWMAHRAGFLGLPQAAPTAPLPGPQSHSMLATSFPWLLPSRLQPGQRPSAFIFEFSLSVHTRCSSSEPFDLPLVFWAGVRITWVLCDARSELKLLVLEAHTASNARTGVGAPILPTHGDKLVCTVTGQSWREETVSRCGLVYSPFPDMSLGRQTTNKHVEVSC